MVMLFTFFRVSQFLEFDVFFLLLLFTSINRLRIQFLAVPLVITTEGCIDGKSVMSGKKQIVLSPKSTTFVINY